MKRQRAQLLKMWASSSRIPGHFWGSLLAVFRVWASFFLLTVPLAEICWGLKTLFCAATRYMSWASCCICVSVGLKMLYAMLFSSQCNRDEAEGERQKYNIIPCWLASILLFKYCISRRFSHGKEAPQNGYLWCRSKSTSQMKAQTLWLGKHFLPPAATQHKIVF